MDLKPIELSYKSLVGLSEKQITEHYEVLYKGYVNKLGEIRHQINHATEEAGNATFSNIRELKLEESFALNAKKLHEAYFLGMGGNGIVTDKVKTAIVKSFGSYENWEAEFRATAMSSRGWTVLYYDWQEVRMRIGLADFHSHGGVWDTSPVLVLDVYEHAYFLDYGTKRKEYIDSWFKNINWAFSEKELDQIEKSSS